MNLLKFVGLNALVEAVTLYIEQVREKQLKLTDAQRIALSKLRDLINAALGG